MSGDPLVAWMRGEVRKEMLLAVGAGVLGVAVLGLFIVGLLAIA